MKIDQILKEEDFLRHQKSARLRWLGHNRENAKPYIPWTYYRREDQEEMITGHGSV